MPRGTTFQTPQRESHRPRASAHCGRATPRGARRASSCASSAADVSISASLRLVATRTSGTQRRCPAAGASSAGPLLSGTPHTAAPHMSSSSSTSSPCSCHHHIFALLPATTTAAVEVGTQLEHAHSALASIFLNLHEFQNTSFFTATEQHGFHTLF